MVVVAFIKYGESFDGENHIEKTVIVYDGILPSHKWDSDKWEKSSETEFSLPKVIG